MKIKNCFGEEYEVSLRVGKYANNDNLFVGLMYVDEDGDLMQYGNVTVNIDKLPFGLGCIDVNNMPILESWLVEQELGEWIGASYQSGFCQYPIFAFNDGVLDMLVDE